MKNSPRAFSNFLDITVVSFLKILQWECSYDDKMNLGHKESQHNGVNRSSAGAVSKTHRNTAGTAHRSTAHRSTAHRSLLYRIPLTAVPHTAHCCTVYRSQLYRAWVLAFLYTLSYLCMRIVFRLFVYHSNTCSPISIFLIQCFFTIGDEWRRGWLEWCKVLSTNFSWFHQKLFPFSQLFTSFSSSDRTAASYRRAKKHKTSDTSVLQHLLRDAKSLSGFSTLSVRLSQMRMASSITRAVPQYLENCWWLSESIV